MRSRYDRRHPRLLSLLDAPSVGSVAGRTHSRFGLDTCNGRAIVVVGQIRGHAMSGDDLVGTWGNVQLIPCSSFKLTLPGASVDTIDVAPVCSMLLQGLGGVSGT